MEIDIEEYYNRYASMVMRRCRSILKDEHLAYDAMQEVFMKLVEKKSKLRGDYPSSLLYTMATNHCLNVLKNRNREVYFSGEIFENIPGSAKGNHEDNVINAEILDIIFENEKSTTRDIAVMYYVDKMTYEEVSHISGLSVSGIRKRLRNLKEKVSGFSEEFL